MRVISWNIQTCRGVDGEISIERIAGIIKQMGDADVICLQEVLANFPTLDDGAGMNQPALLQALFPDHELFFVPAVNHSSGHGRALFGNLILSRFEVIQSVQYGLPQPADPGITSMPRIAIEVIVRAGDSLIRVLTTHLEYFSLLQRKTQSRFLYSILSNATERAKLPVVPTGKVPYSNVPQSLHTIACGDFNFEPGSDEYDLIRSDGNTQLLFDAWTLASNQPHAPTCGIYDHQQWPMGPHCRDFFFVSESLAGQINCVEVNLDTDASDHQPIKLELKGL